MSLQFRERLKQLQPSDLEISQQEWQAVWENIGDFCLGSDNAIKARFGQDADEEAEICKMNDEQFLGFAREVLSNVLARLGYRKKKKGTPSVETDTAEQYDEAIANEQGRHIVEEYRANEQRISNV